jgi:cell division septation protein DedD
MIPIQPDTAAPASETSEMPIANPMATPKESIEDAAPPEPGKKPVPMVWIPAVLGLGLLIAASYLGARIVTANRHPAAPAKIAVAKVRIKPAPQPALPQLAPTVATVQNHISSPAPEAAAASQASIQTRPKAEPVAPRAAVEKPALNEEIPTITPKHGQRFIQVGALDLELTRRYLPQLRQEKLEPHVAPGPSPDLLRVLIGPFEDRDSLQATKVELDKAGIENFIRVY